MAQVVTFVLVALSIAAGGALCVLLVIFLPNEDPRSDWSGPPLPCVPRTFTGDTTVCVCNATYCDTMEEVPSLRKGQGVTYTSTKSGLRFMKEEMKHFTSDSVTEVHLVIDTSQKYQKMKGFGGAFTDAAGMNMYNLSSEAREKLLQSYFSPQGIEYTIGRIPMASCDFSTRLYTYADDVNDFNMVNFALAMEDFTYKIPVIKRAMEMNKRKMSLYASPWTAPIWMKTNNAYYGRGSLIGEPGNEYHQAWALYFARFIEEYKKNGVDIWGVTAQNEPRDGLAPDFEFQCMGFTAEHQRDFIKTDLGPTLRSRGHGDVVLMIGDDQRDTLPSWAITVLEDQDAAQYVSGIAVHWYTDWVVGPHRLTETHEAYPDRFILGSEACAAAMPWVTEHVILGSWTRGQQYSQDIIEDVNNWAVGWTDWNLALDMEGGPNWVKNFVDSPIIVNAEEDEFYKQPMFYHLGHFSKFVPENSIRVDVSGVDQDGDLKYTSFVNPEETLVSLIVLNKSTYSIHLKITVSADQEFSGLVPPESIQTYVMSIV